MKKGERGKRNEGKIREYYTGKSEERKRNEGKENQRLPSCREIG